MLGFKSPLTKQEAQGAGLSDAFDAAPVAPLEPVQSQDEAEQLALRAAKLKAEEEATAAAIDATKWDALQAQISRAAKLKAELAQIENRLAQHKDTIAEKEREAAAAAKQAANEAKAVRVAAVQKERLAAWIVQVEKADGLARTLRQTMHAIVKGALEYKDGSEEWPYGLVTDKAQRPSPMPQSFDKWKTFNSFSDAECQKIFATLDPLTARLLQAILQEQNEVSALKAKVGSRSIESWLPEPEKSGATVTPAGGQFSRPLAVPLNQWPR